MPNWNAINSKWRTINPAHETDLSGSLHWSATATRQDRYDLFEAFATLTIYGSKHADSIRREYRAYDEVRPVASPFATIVDFAAEHLLGPDTLDPDAGPGDPKPSCLPIIVGDDAIADPIRRAIANLWEASNFAANKELLGWYGAALGDVGIEAVADDVRGKVRMRIVHPGEVTEHEPDAYGYTRHVAFERDEIDPDDRNPKKELRRKVTYRRTITNEKGIVTVRTFRDDRPYQWPDTPGEKWQYPWGFVPFVLIQHKTRGKLWGVSELSNMLARGIELDSQESVLNDQTIKAEVMPVAMFGIKPTKDRNGNPEAIVLSGSATDGRNDYKILYVTNENAKIQPLVYPVPISECNDRNKRLELIVARDYPELLASDPVGLAASGEARREARKKATTKINNRRTAYDKAIVRIHQMAMTMGYERGFEGYEFQGSWERIYPDQTAHSIGRRPVFSEDPIETIAQHKAEAEAAMAWYDGGQGTTIQWAMEQVGIPAERIDKLMKQLAQDEADARQFQSDQFGVVPPEDEEEPTGLEEVA